MVSKAWRRLFRRARKQTLDLLPQRSKRIPYFLAGAVALDTVVLFVGASAGCGRARTWLVLTGSEAPEPGQGLCEDVIVSALAIAGYALVPTMIALAVTAAVGGAIRERVVSEEEFDDYVMTLVASARRRGLRSLERNVEPVMDLREPDGTASGARRQGW